MSEKEVKEEKQPSPQEMEKIRQEQEKRAEKEQIKALQDYYTANALRMQIQKLDQEIEKKKWYLSCLRKALKIRVNIERGGIDVKRRNKDKKY